MARFFFRLVEIDIAPGHDPFGEEPVASGKDERA